MGKGIVGCSVSVCLFDDYQRDDCRKKCYTEGKGVIASHTDEMTAGNLIVGGVVGLAVDAGSGVMNQYEPQIQVAMTPIKSCKA